MTQFVVINEGLLHVLVCSELPEDELTVAVNAYHPPGTHAGWHIDKETADKRGQRTPITCEDEPKTKKHWLFVC